MSKVLIVAEHSAGRLKKLTGELLGASASAGNETHAAIFGVGVDTLAAEAARRGADKVHLLQDSAFTRCTAEAYSTAIAQLAGKLGFEVILSGHSAMGRDFMPRVAAKLGVGLASDCTQLKFAGAGIVVRRPICAGKATVEVGFCGPGPRMATLRPDFLGAPKQDFAKTAEIVVQHVELGPLRSKVLEVVEGRSARPDVTEAAVVVSGGRGVKGAAGFNLLEALADELAAAVGASRAAVDAGHRPQQDQVGQTGKVVSPALYIACGISGAIQHLVGMKSSRVIVAINSDSEAPIFQIADYGIVGDLFEVLPLLIDELKRLKKS